jgi:hypothetical protein
MPFGKFEDRPLSELPSEYLVWLAKLPDIRDPLRSRVVAELCQRPRRALCQGMVPPG